MDAYVGGTWVSPSGAEAYIGGAWRTLQYAEAYIGGSWRTVANFTPPSPGGGGGGGGTLSLSVSPTSISKVGSPTTFTTGYITVTPSGGLAPYSYVWSIVSSDPGPTFTLTAPGYASTKVSGTGFPLTDTPYNCTIHCVVTDSLGVTATTDNVVATLTYSPSGGTP